MQTKERSTLESVTNETLHSSVRIIQTYKMKDYPMKSTWIAFSRGSGMSHRQRQKIERAPALSKDILNAWKRLLWNLFALLSLRGRPNARSGMNDSRVSHADFKIRPHRRRSWVPAFLYGFESCHRQSWEKCWAFAGPFVLYSNVCKNKESHRSVQQALRSQLTTR